MTKSHRAYIPDRISPDLKSVKGRNIAGVLAIAAEYDIPFERVLRSMSPYEFPFIVDIFYSLFYPILWLLKIKKGRGYKRVNVAGVKPTLKGALDSAVTEMEQGCSLGYVLEAHLSFWLPDYYITAVQHAEDNGTLKETLIQLADTMNKVKKRRVERFYVLLHPMLFTLTLLFFYAVIFRRGLSYYWKITYGLDSNYELPWITQLVLNVTRPVYYYSPFAWLLFLQLPWVIYYFFFTQKGDWLLVKIPFINRPLLRGKLIESIQALLAYSKINLPMPQALDRICDTLPSCSLKRTFIEIKKEVEQGIPLQNSWVKHFPKDHLSNFYMKTGFENNNLPEFLEKLLLTLHEDDERKHYTSIRLAEPALIFISAILVGAVTMAHFLPLIDMFEIGVRWEN